MHQFLSVFVFVLALQLSACNVAEEGDLFEGDIVLTEEQKIDIQMSIDGMNAPATFGASRYKNWPKFIPYQINPALGSTGRSKIKEAIDDYHKYTCLRFYERKTTGAYVYFTTGTGCSSPIAYRRNRVNNIKLARGCLRKGIIIHEIMHTLGFFHEQSRPDRDRYVTINWDNIPEARKNNFKKYSYGTIKSGDSKYDYLSVMHYGRTYFGRGKVTIDAKNDYYDMRIGQRRGFSTEDVRQIRAKYRC